MTPPNTFIVGAQSTGKTTLVSALGQLYNDAAQASTPGPIVISEVARNVLKELNIDRDDIANSAEKCLQLQYAILRAQLKAECAANLPNVWYISDRSGIDPIVYARLFVGHTASEELLQTPEWLALEHHMQEGLVFLCEAGCPWLVDDGTRLMPKDAGEWHRVDKAFRSLLDTRGIKFHVIPADLTAIEDRVAMVQGLMASTKLDGSFNGVERRNGESQERRKLQVDIAPTVSWADRVVP